MCPFYFQPFQRKRFPMSQATFYLKDTTLQLETLYSTTIALWKLSGSPFLAKFMILLII